jgi:hypothetical protein
MPAPRCNQSKTVKIQVLFMGEDVIFLITGGRAHFGAVATAYVTGDTVAHVDVLSLPSHKEAELAAELGERASHELGRTVVVLVGIHLENPSRQDIKDIVEEVKKKMSQALYHWNDIAKIRTEDATTNFILRR